VGGDWRARRRPFVRSGFSLRIDVELETDRTVAVGDLEDHPRLEVVRALLAVLVLAAAAVLKTTLARVLDVGGR
jgi:hypothetical protein